MAQHDYTIANQTFPNTRTDINNALSAIVSQNSGASAPSTTYAYQLWYDTTNNKLKQRNADDDAWIDLFDVDQVADTATPSSGGAGGGGKVLQVVQAVDTAVSSVSCARGALVDLGLSATITPASATNKILVMASASVSTNAVDQSCVITLYQGGSASSFIGDAASNRQRNTAMNVPAFSRAFATTSFSYLASVSNTSPVTFALYGSHPASVTRTLYVNQSSSDTDVDYEHRGASSIILMEIQQ